MKSAAILSLVAAASALDSHIFAVTQDTSLAGGFTVAAADAKCQTEGGANYLAFLGDEAGTDTATLLTGANVIRPNDNAIINTHADFFDENVAANVPILTFAGAGATFVWTGIADNGASRVGFTCNDWTEDTNTAQGGVGLSNFLTGLLEQGENDCDTPFGAWYCYENAAASSGNLDPHFFGFNGEKLDIEHDDTSADKAFSVFCTEDVEFNTLFSSTVDGLLYMTKFWIRVQDVKVVVEMNGQPLIISGEYEKSYHAEANRTRLAFENVAIEYSDARTYVNFNGLRFNFAQAELNRDQFLNFDIVSENFERFPAGGLVGRTMMNKLTEAEFADYKRFALPAIDGDYFNQECHL